MVELLAEFICSMNTMYCVQNLSGGGQRGIWCSAIFKMEQDTAQGIGILCVVLFISVCIGEFVHLTQNGTPVHFQAGTYKMFHPDMEAFS